MSKKGRAAVLPFPNFIPAHLSSRPDIHFYLLLSCPVPAAVAVVVIHSDHGTQVRLTPQ